MKEGDDSMIRLFKSCRSATDSIPRPLMLRRLLSGGGSTSGSRKILTLETINQNVVKMEYAVRGNILTQANEIKSQMKNVSKTRAHMERMV